LTDPRERWAMLAVICAARTSMALQFQSIAPVAAVLVPDLGLTYAKLGLLIGVYFLPGAVIALTGGMLGQRFGNRPITLWALALMTLGGLVTATSSTFPLAVAGRAVSGAGAVLLTLILTKMTAEWFREREISTAMSVMVTTWPFGIGIGTACFGMIAVSASWRTVQYLTTAATAMSLVLVALVYRDAQSVPPSGTGLQLWPRMPGRAWTNAVVAGVAWMLFNVGFIVLVGFTPSFLVAEGRSVAMAGMMVSVAVWVSVLSVPLGGIVADRTRRGDLAIAAGAGLTALAIAAVPLTTVPLTALMLGGIVVGLAPGALIALLPKSVSVEYLAPAYGIFYAVYYLGMATLQPLAGLLRDGTGRADAPIFFAAVVMAATLVAARAFRRVAPHGGQG
jgi:MFS family permease